jgi:glutamine amidotransferase
MYSRRILSTGVKLTVSLLNYGVGNISALANMLDFIGTESVVVADRASLARATKIILPGVGSFDNAIRRLDTMRLREALLEAVCIRKRPVLGICLGMQLLGHASEEGQETGLGLIDADTRRIRPNDPALKVPHMGWAELRPTQSSVLFPQPDMAERFYFAHSYHVVCTDPGHVLAEIDHGARLAAAVQVDNVMGVQFHPEKSHRFGAALLKRFVEL